MAIKVSEMQELRDMGSPDNKYVYVVTESQGGDGNEYNKMSLRTIVDNAGGNNPTPHPCFTYDDNRFITGVHQASPPNVYVNGDSPYYYVTQKHIYDDYALGIITLGGKSGTQLEVLECPNVEYISSMAVNNVPLVRAIFPNLRQVGTNLFYGKSTLTYVDLGKIEEISVSMFSGCSNLNNVTIPNTTT